MKFIYSLYSDISRARYIVIHVPLIMLNKELIIIKIF